MAALRAFGPVVMAGLATYALVAGLARRHEVGALASVPPVPGEAGTAATLKTEPIKPGLFAVLLRAFNDTMNDNIGLIAASVAFYTLMAIFPGLAALVALYGLVANPSDIAHLLAMLQGILPGEVADLISKELANLVAQPSSGLSLTGIGATLLALISARSGVGALMTALDIAYDERETRNFFWFNLSAFLLTSGAVLFAIASLSALALWPVVADYLPIADATKFLGSWLRWPILAMIVLINITFIYRFGPSRSKPCWHLFSLGSIVATFLWLAASLAFSFYVSKFGSYDQTYGSIGAVIALLMWLWISAYIVLFGAELNRELERVTGTCRNG
jgi:membrane protein